MAKNIYVLTQHIAARLVNSNYDLRWAYPLCEAPEIKVGQTIVSVKGYRNGKISKLFHEDCWRKAHK